MIAKAPTKEHIDGPGVYIGYGVEADEEVASERSQLLIIKIAELGLQEAFQPTRALSPVSIIIVFPEIESHASGEIGDAAALGAIIEVHFVDPEADSDGDVVASTSVVPRACLRLGRATHEER